MPTFDRPQLTSLTVRRVQGEEIKKHIGDLARLRITVFREFPYLYDGDDDYERRYLSTYELCEESVIVLVTDGDTVVGASSGLPLAAEPPDAQEPFHSRGLDVSSIFYFGESVLLPQYRGLGLGRRFFEERELHARSLHRFRSSCFCSVERSEHDPRKPVNYVPLHSFWRAMGYEIMPDFRTYFSWKDVGEEQETLKPMIFWSKGF